MNQADMTKTLHTPGPIGIHKCRCGHPSCNQYTLGTQRSVGFDHADAVLYAAAPELLAALQANLGTLQETVRRLSRYGKSSHELLVAIEEAGAAIAKATGQAVQS